MVKRCGGVVLPHGNMHILAHGRDQVVLSDQLWKVLKAQALQLLLRGRGADDVGPPGGRIRIQIPAVVEEAAVVRLHIFPHPVLSRQLAVAAVQRGDIFPAVIPQKFLKKVSRKSRTHMEGVQQRIPGHGERLVAGDKQAYLRCIRRHGVVPLFPAAAVLTTRTGPFRSPAAVCLPAKKQPCGCCRHGDSAPFVTCLPRHRRQYLKSRI